MPFANPYLVCAACGERVTSRDDLNRPCGHKASFDSVCPSWGPVDGCSCDEFLGYRPHPLASEDKPETAGVRQGDER